MTNRRHYDRFNRPGRRITLRLTDEEYEEIQDWRLSEDEPLAQVIKRRLRFGYY